MRVSNKSNLLRIFNKGFEIKYYQSSMNLNSYFRESKQFWREPKGLSIKPQSHQNMQKALLSYILQHSPKNSPQKVLQLIDKFSQINWMMHFGPEKRKIFNKIIDQNKIKNILQAGTYCGYSAIALSQCKLVQPSSIVSFEKDKNMAQIAKKIISHSGLKNIQVIQKPFRDGLQSLIKKQIQFDLIFFDQQQDEYLDDLKYLQKIGIIKTGTFIIADNVIHPGSPNYLKYLRDKATLEQNYSSVLYYTYDAYTDIPDGVLVSRKL